MELKSTSKVQLHFFHLRGVRLSRGFTMVEILVVMAIMAIVGTIMVAIFTNTLRGSNKSQILAVMKQNGQAVLDNMDRTIRSADSVVCRSMDGNTLVIVKNGEYIRFRLLRPNNQDSSKGTCGSLNGCIQQDFPVQPSTPPKNNTAVFVNGLCTDPMGSDSIAPQTLTDTNPQTGVSAQNIGTGGLFSTTKQAGSKDNVTIKFGLAPPVGLPTAVSSQIDPVAFQTTIQLR